MIKTQDLMMDGGKISKQVVTRQCLGGGGGGTWASGGGDALPSSK